LIQPSPTSARSTSARLAFIPSGGAAQQPQRRPSRWPSVLGALLAVLLIAGTAVVAGAVATGGSATRSVALTAYETTVANGSADISYSSSISSLDVSSGTGVFSWTTNQGEMNYTSSFTFLGAGSPQISASGTELIMGSVSYTRWSVTGLPSNIEGGFNPNNGMWSKTTWSGSPDIAMEYMFYEAFPLLGEGTPPSPGSLLTLLQSQASSISDLGSEVVGGVETTHYRALVPFSRLGASPQKVKQAEEMLGTTGFTFDFWVDSSQRLRRMTFGLTLQHPPPGSKGKEGAQKFPMTIMETLNISNYGVPVDVAAPPSSEVTPGGTCSWNSGGFNCEDSSS
jgi:hypothetical protein